MEFEYSEKNAMVYEVLSNIENAVTTLLNRTEQKKRCLD